MSRIVAGTDRVSIDVSRVAGSAAARTGGVGHQAHALQCAGHGTSYVAANQVYDETMLKNARFKKIYEQWKQFRAEEVLWFRVVENTLGNFMARPSAANRL